MYLCTNSCAKMKISLIQFDIFWEDISKNLAVLKNKIPQIPHDTDIIVLPEMFSTGFTMNPENVAETEQGESLDWMIKTAKQMQKAIVGSLAIKENDNYYNRLYFVFPDGSYQSYDKRHLFTLAGEDKKYTYGSKKLIINYKDWKFCLLICYDLRFPVFSRNTEDYDALIYIANWPERRINAWDILLRARAVENMSYTIGVNRIGTDINDNHYTGHTQVIDTLGNYILPPQTTKGIFTVILDKKQQNELREKLGFLNDRDDFSLNH